MESHHSINIAQTVPGPMGTYAHYCRLTLPPMLHETAVAMLADTRMRYPAPQFKCELTYWLVQGRTIDE